MNINCFLDTNVIIGFIYTFNSLYEYSKELFSKGYEHYYSTNVKNEVEEVFDRKNKEFKILFQRIIRNLKKLRDSQFISNAKIHGIINKFNRIGRLKLDDMHNAFETIWKDFGYGENQEIGQVILELNELAKELHSRHSNRKESIEESMIEIPNHRLKDEDILNIIKEKSLREYLHEKDEDILFDINQYGKEHPELDLCLVSWDDDFIDAVRILSNQLSFKKYIGRKFKSV